MTAIIRFANAHGFEAIARDDGAAVLIFIPTYHRATREKGIETVEVSSMSAARDALGY